MTSVIRVRLRRVPVDAPCASVCCLRFELERQVRQRIDRTFELLMLLCAQRALRTLKDHFELFDWKVPSLRFLLSLPSSPLLQASASFLRKPLVSARPSTSLTGRFGRLVLSLLPRPVVRPINTQLAAR